MKSREERKKNGEKIVKDSARRGNRDNKTFCLVPARRVLHINFNKGLTSFWIWTDNFNYKAPLHKIQTNNVIYPFKESKHKEKWDAAADPGFSKRGLLNVQRCSTIDGTFWSISEWVIWICEYLFFWEEDKGTVHLPSFPWIHPWDGIE